MSWLKVLLVVAIVLLAGGLVLGRYTALRAADGWVFVMDRITGASWFCNVDGECKPTKEPALLSDEAIFGAPKQP